MNKSLRDLSHARRDEVITPTPKAAKPRRADLMKQTIVYQTDECLRQLRVLAAERSTTVSALVGEGINMMFRQYGKPQIAVDKAAKDG